MLTNWSLHKSHGYPHAGTVQIWLAIHYEPPITLAFETCDEEEEVSVCAY